MDHYKKKLVTVINQTALLLDRMKEGDVDAFNELYELTTAYVQFTVRRQLNDCDDWEDVVQEIYVAVYQQYPNLDNTQAGFAWIRQIAFRKACDYSRKRQKVRMAAGDIYDIADAAELADDSIPMPEDILENRESQAIVRKAISELSDVQRNALIGYYYDNMRVSEIAEAMDIPVGTVKTALARGRKALKEKMVSYEKKGYWTLSAISGAGLFVAFLGRETEVQAQTLPAVEQLVREAAAAHTGTAVGKSAGYSGKMAETAADAGKTGKATAAGSGVAKAAKAGGAGFFATRAVPIIIAAAVAAGGIGGGMYVHKQKSLQQESVATEQDAGNADMSVDISEPDQSSQQPETSAEETTASAAEAAAVENVLPDIEVGDAQIELLADEFDEYGNVFWQLSKAGGEVELNDAAMSGIISSAHCYDDPYNVDGLDMDLFGKQIDVSSLPEMDDAYDEDNLMSGLRDGDSYIINPECVLDSTVDVTKIEKNGNESYTVIATIFRDPAMAEKLLRDEYYSREERKEMMSRRYPIGSVYLTIVPNSESRFGYTVTGVNYHITQEEADDLDQELTDKELLQIAHALGVPEGMDVRFKQSSAYYNEVFGCYLKYVQVYDTDGNELCATEVNLGTLEPCSKTRSYEGE